MDTERRSREPDMDSMLNFLKEGCKPYEGEIKEPTTMLDAAVLDTIVKFGNENMPPPPNPYKPWARESSIQPSTYHEDFFTHELTFGLDYLAHSFLVPGFNVICTYHQGSGHARTIMDKLDDKLGLATRIEFNSRPEAPDIIIKQQRTYYPYELSMDIPDFYRELKKTEVTKLLELLGDPMEHHEVVIALSTVTRKEAGMAERNRARRREEIKKYNEIQQHIVDARYGIMHE